MHELVPVQFRVLRPRERGVGIAPERFRSRHEQESEWGDGATQEEFRTNGSEEKYGQLKTRGSAFSAELEIAGCGL
ncbi:hypothetical protein R1flu_018039 [Riccia fluitans]|uniref:Uncharacterized protein n=1 Tax=Riccia fluitans TaxID=41844 RepID=A0ABD1ZH02_9MARC